MSSLTAGLGRKKDDEPNSDKASRSERTSSSPSLTALASRTTSTSLSSLATMRASQTSPAANTNSSTPAASQRPSLTSLASTSGSTPSRPGLSSLGASSGSTTGGLGSRPSLTALARNANPAHGIQSTTTTTTARASTRPALTQLSANRPATGAPLGAVSSTGVLPPRRSLVGLAKVGSGLNAAATPTNVPSSAATTSGSEPVLHSDTEWLKPSPSVGLTARSGSSLAALTAPLGNSGLGGLSGLARNTGSGSNGGGGLGGGLQRQSSLGSTLGSSNSPSLSGLASRSLQSRASPSLAGLSKRTESNSATTYTQDQAKDSREGQSQDQNAAQEELGSTMSSSQSDFKDDSAAYGQESNESFATMAEQFAASSPFSSLIAKPSHFAVSIFERLDPVPVPIAFETAAKVVSFDPSPLAHASETTKSSQPITSEVAVAVSKLALIAETEASVRAKVFQFDQPSPDDIVFKAQGSRATVTGIGSR